MELALIAQDCSKKKKKDELLLNWLAVLVDHGHQVQM